MKTSKNVNKMFFIKKREATPEGSISSEPQLPSRKWLEFPAPRRGEVGVVAQKNPCSS